MQFEESLKIYEYWEGLSPRRFERAIKLKLRDEGYNLNVTQYLGDGGVDLEGVDENGYPVIVQAKKYKSNVGVSVVREMIGVRSSRKDQPLTIIVSLVGFTSGAIQLANDEGIILKSIKNDILKI